MKDLHETLISYFGGKIIGSMLFVETGLLKIHEINDIDIAVHKDSEQGIRAFLKDRGFTEEKPQYQGRYGTVEGNKRFVQEGYKPIHLTCVTNLKNYEVYDLPTLVGKKFALASESDLKQLALIVKRQQPKEQ